MAKSYTDKKTYLSKTGSMLINPYHSGLMMEEYEILIDVFNQYKEVKAKTHDTSSFDEHDFEKYVRYAALIFDPHSPLAKEYTDIKMRREKAAREVGYGGYDNRAIEVLMLRDVYRSREWTLISSIDNLYSELTDKVNKIVAMTEDPDKELKAVEFKGKIIDQMGQLIVKRKELVKEFYGGDDDLEEYAGSGSAEDWIRKIKRK